MASAKHEPLHLSRIIMRMTPMATNIITGAAFGSALTLSGVYKPSVIISQMQLRNFHMLQTFLAASAVSVIVVQFATKTGYCPPQTRPPFSFCRLPPYSGNIIGGLLIGTSMALTGACPGTAMIQGALGSLSGLYVGLGGLLGGIAFIKLAPLLHHTSIIAAYSSKSPVSGAEAGSDKPLQQPVEQTIAAKLGVATSTVVLAYEALCIGMIVLAARLLPNNPTSVNPILGGIAIGAAQALSLLLSRKTIGVTAAHEELGQDFWNILLPSTHAKPSSHSAVWFAIGMMLGAKALTTQVPMLMPSAEMQKVKTLWSLVGGAIMLFGAGLADGCPGGHGISGLATLSLSSFVTVAGMFGGGILCKALIG